MPVSRSLSSRFALLMGLAGLAFGLLVAGLLQWHIERSTLAGQRQALTQAANQINDLLGADLRARRREISLTAGLLEKTGLASPVDIRSLLERLQREQPSYAWIGLTDATGRVVAATQSRQEGADASRRPWFQAGRQGAHRGDPHEASMLAADFPPGADGEPVRFADVAVPLTDASGTLRGVLAAHLHWTWVRKVIDRVAGELAHPVPIQVFVLDRQGAVLSVPPGTPVASAAPDDASGAYLTARSTAIPVAASALGWSVLARQSMRDLQAPLQEVRLGLLGFAATLGAAFIGLTWLVARRVTQPIVRFADEARRFDVEGPLPFKAAAEERSDELGTLARTMAALVERSRVLAGRNQLFIEHAPVPLAIFDDQMRYLSASRRWLSDYGIEGQDVIGRSHYDVFPEIPDHWRRFHQRALQGEVLQSQRDRFVREDGHTQWLRWELRPWHRPDGVVGGIAVFTEDITARVEAEHAVAASESKFRATFEQAAVGIAHVDTAGRWLLVNERLCDIVGYPREELLRKTFQDITHEDDLDRDLSRMNALLAGDVAHYQIDKRYRRKDGGIVWITLTVALVRKPDGAPDYFVSVVEDISERKRAELALHDSERRMRLASAAARVGIFDLDIQSDALLWTPELEALYGQPPQAQGALRTYQDWLQTLHPDDVAVAGAAVQQALQSKQRVQAEWRVVWPDGSVRWLAACFQSFDDARGQPGHLIGANIDISRQKVMEAELRDNARLLADFNERLSRQVAEQTEEIRRARDHADAANRAKGGFLANMSHEIRTPLNGVLGMAQIGYRDSFGRDKAQATFKRILDSGKLLLTIVNDILDFSKIEAGKLEVESVPLDPSRIVDEVLQGVAELASAKSLPLVAEKAALPRAMLGDPVRITQILYNLLSNAIKFTERGEIRLSASTAGDSEDPWLVLAVRDTGIGIDDAMSRRLFQPFEQADGSFTRRFGGTGLGLAISRRLADLMGGTLEVHSQPGQGSVFTLRLPMRATDLPAPQAGAHGLSGARRLARMHLLVAEDNTINQIVLDELLRGEGAEVVLVDDGRAAVARVLQSPRPFDAVLMDVQMPVMDGLEATRALRRMQPGLQVIGQTAHALKEEIDRCLDAGMVATLQKPIDLEILVSTLLELKNASPCPGVAGATAVVDRSVRPSPGIDRAAFERRHAARPEFGARLSKVFCERHAGDPVRLRDFATRRDFDGMESLAHELKGSAGAVFAIQVEELAAMTLEHARQRNDAATEDAHALAAALEQALEALAVAA